MGGIYLCVSICAIIWLVNGICILQAIRDHITSEIYMHTGLGIFFSVLVLELTVGKQGIWGHADYYWIAFTGWLLYIPSAIIVITSIIELHRKGKPKGADFTATTTIIDSGIYGYLRQPMTLGMAIWSVALVLVFQSLPALILSFISLFCFRMSARTESEYNIKKFGRDYQEYMKRVPMWNVFKSSKK